jgi:hypothetical protein
MSSRGPDSPDSSARGFSFRDSVFGRRETSVGKELGRSGRSLGLRVQPLPGILLACCYYRRCGSHSNHRSAQHAVRRFPGRTGCSKGAQQLTKLLVLIVTLAMTNSGTPWQMLRLRR